ncbi:MAG: NAD(P)H-hydrate epimerase [Chloroflexi bacterium]|nr:NAD(P)H-hydrate epimerase [Chloroflexota bacterium]MDA1003556.1 NAD(P)H-hydrate epimerase [Chloroflexota bacterium]
MTASVRRIFTTEEGVPVPALSVAEMREVDRVAATQTGPTVLQMVEHAGMGLALSAIEMIGARWRDAEVTVLVGSGGNGAGGVCAARHLANRGVRVLVVTILPPPEADGALGQQFLALGESPARVIRAWEAFDVAQSDLVIDAVIGYSLDGAPRVGQMALIRAANASTTPVLSLDVPSGVDADTGETPGVAVTATRTLTLALPKRGLNALDAGELWLQDLGITPGVYARAGLAFPPVFGESDRVRLHYPAAGSA